MCKQKYLKALGSHSDLLELVEAAAIGVELQQLVGTGTQLGIPPPDIVPLLQGTHTHTHTSSSFLSHYTILDYISPVSPSL